MTKQTSANSESTNVYIDKITCLKVVMLGRKLVQWNHILYIKGQS